MKLSPQGWIYSSDIRFAIRRNFLLESVQSQNTTKWQFRWYRDGSHVVTRSVFNFFSSLKYRWPIFSWCTPDVITWPHQSSCNNLVSENFQLLTKPFKPSFIQIPASHSIFFSRISDLRLILCLEKLRQALPCISWSQDQIFWLRLRLFTLQIL